MSRGLKTGGRKKGVPNKRTAQSVRVIKAAAEAGITPLEYMLNVMRAPEPTAEDGEEPHLFVARYTGWRDRAFEAAKSSAPYMHPRLTSTEVTGKDGGPLRLEQIVGTDG